MFWNMIFDVIMSCVVIFVIGFPVIKATILAFKILFLIWIL